LSLDEVSNYTIKRQKMEVKEINPNPDIKIEPIKVT
jgi:hypothetical protein